MTMTKAALRESGWWLTALWRVVRQQPGVALVLTGSLWLARAWVPLHALLLVGLLGVSLRAWWLVDPRAFMHCIGGPLRAWWWTLTLRHEWSQVAEACGLAGPPVRPLRLGDVNAVGRVPAILSVERRWPRVAVSVEPALGQSIADYEKAADGLRHSLGALQLRVEPQCPNRILLTFAIGDTLRAPFPAATPRAAANLDEVVVGRVENGQPWLLPLGPHTLVAGCSGAGKGSVFWSFAFGLAPAVRDGFVQLHGIDLKGGMELLMGRQLFTSCATTPSDAVALLEHLVESMRARTERYAGRVRAHTPTTDEPLHVVMIDELAALTAYCSERVLQRRAEMAINLLCSQGRAPGFVVFACLQDPRKEVIPSRGLFTQMVGLRLKDLSETSMVLGETAVTSGAWCHRISRDVPGTGFVVPEDGGPPIRVRAGYASDEAIREVAQRFGTARVRVADKSEAPPSDVAS